MKEHTEIACWLIGVEETAVLGRDDECVTFRNDRKNIVDERRWGIALWSKAWAGSLVRRSVANFSVRKGNLLYELRCSDSLIVDPVSPLVLRS